MNSEDSHPVDRSVDIRRANCGCAYDRISGLLYSRCPKHPPGHRKSIMAGPLGRPDDPPDLEQKATTDNPTLRKQLFNAASAATTGERNDALNERTLRDCIPYDERERPAYDLLCDARELIGRAHDLIVRATDYHGDHNVAVLSLCSRLNEIIEQLHTACGVVPPA